jgi:hypothetical protein
MPSGVNTSTGPEKPASSSLPTGSIAYGCCRAKPGPSNTGQLVILVADSSRAAMFTVEPIAV